MFNWANPNRPADVHRRDDGLMCGARVGANRDRTAIGTGFFEQRGPQRVGIMALIKLRSFTL